MEEENEQPAPKSAFRVKVDLTDILRTSTSACKHPVVWYFVDTIKCDTLGAVKSAVLEMFKVDAKAELIEVTLDDCVVPDDTTVMFLNIGDVLSLRFIGDDSAKVATSDVAPANVEPETVKAEPVPEEAKAETAPETLKAEPVPEEAKAETAPETVIAEITSPGDSERLREHETGLTPQIDGDKQEASTESTKTEVDHSVLSKRSRCDDDEAVEPDAKCSKSEDVVAATVVSERVSTTLRKRKRTVSLEKRRKNRHRFIRNLLERQAMGQDIIWPPPTSEDADLLEWDVLDESEDSNCEVTEEAPPPPADSNGNEVGNINGTSQASTDQSGPSVASKAGAPKAGNKSVPAIGQKKAKRNRMKNMSPSRHSYMMRNSFPLPPPFLTQLPNRAKRQVSRRFRPDLMSVSTTEEPYSEPYFEDRSGYGASDEPPYFEDRSGYRGSNERSYFEEEGGYHGGNSNEPYFEGNDGFRGGSTNEPYFKEGAGFHGGSSNDPYYHSGADGSYWCNESPNEPVEYRHRQQPSFTGFNEPNNEHGDTAWLGYGGRANNNFAAGPSSYAAQGTNQKRKWRKKKNNKNKNKNNLNVQKDQSNVTSHANAPLKGILKRSSEAPMDQVDEVNEEFVENPPPVDFSKYEHLKGPPQMNDVIAYKIFEPSETGNAEVSKFKVGRVVSYDADMQEVMLERSKSGADCANDGRELNEKVVLDVGCFVDARLVSTN